MESKTKPTRKKLLLMGSSAFKNRELPAEVKERIDKAIESKMTIIVGEAPGANRLYQDYLKTKGYRNVIAGHAVRLRYNAGDWRDVKYGKDLKERERKMIEDSDSAVVIWMNNSGVIANNLEILKRLGKPTFLYECSSKTDETRAGELDPNRIYNPFYHMKEHFKRSRTR
ncbi:MAG: hypothetical protein PVF15_02930 [Candidatus Bathyarchaeota archaeon]